MKNFALIAITSAISFQAHSFEDFVQDASENETHIGISESRISQEVKLTNPSAKINADRDVTSFSLRHIIALDSNNLLGLGISIDKESDDTEDSTETELSAAYITKATESNSAQGFMLSYEIGDSDEGDDMTLSFLKELRSPSNLKLDGLLEISMTKTFDAEGYSGGNILDISSAGRYFIMPNFRIIGGLGLMFSSDIEYDDGWTYSPDTSLYYVLGAGYEFSQSVVLDVSYVKGKFSGTYSESGYLDKDRSAPFSSYQLSLSISI